MPQVSRLSSFWSARRGGRAIQRSVTQDVAALRDLLQLEGASLSREFLTPRGPEQLSTALVRVDRRARLQIYIHVDRLDDVTVAELEAAGLMVEQTAPKYGIVQGWIPFERMRDLAALANVRRIRPPDYAVSRARGGQLPPSPGAAGSRP